MDGWRTGEVHLGRDERKEERKSLHRGCNAAYQNAAKQTARELGQTRDVLCKRKVTLK